MLDTDAVLVLFRVISEANRSEIHLKFVQLALCILVNVVRFYDPLQHVALFSQGKELMLDTMLKNLQPEHQSVFSSAARVLDVIITRNLEKEVSHMIPPLAFPEIQSFFMTLCAKPRRL